MLSVPIQDLEAALRRLNEGPVDETLAQALFGAAHHLIAYGSLAPERENHHLLDGLSGKWCSGFVEGDLEDRGWGAGLGYPALRRRSGAPRVPAWLLVSADLAGAWARLDAFEGDGYRRILAPFHRGIDEPPAVVGYLYEGR